MRSREEMNGANQCLVLSQLSTVRVLALPWFVFSHFLSSKFYFRFQFSSVVAVAAAVWDAIKGDTLREYKTYDQQTGSDYQSKTFDLSNLNESFTLTAGWNLSNRVLIEPKNKYDPLYHLTREIQLYKLSHFDHFRTQEKEV